MKILKQVKRSPFLLPLAIVATLIMIFIAESGYRQTISMIEKLDEIRTLRMNVRNFLQAIVDTETAQRGYLLTSRKDYLQPYPAASMEISRSLGVLDQYFRNDPENAARMKRLHASVETKQSELALTLRMYDEGKVEQSLEIMLSGIGKENMDVIRTTTSELLEQEGKNYAKTKQSAFTIINFNRIGVMTLTLLSLLGLSMYVRQSRSLDRKQQELQTMLQAERDRLEAVVTNRTAQLVELAKHLQNAREDERGRLARDLHDELGAFFTSAKLDAARIKSRLAGTAPEVHERLQHLVDTLNTGIALKRRIIEDLRPSALSNLGLVTTLQILTREFAERSGIPVHCSLEPVKLEEATELVVYRIVQEAMTNISKYAKASQVWVNLNPHQGQVEVLVRDDGIGFDTTQQRGSAHGLLGMRFRVEAERGTMTLVSAPGQGTLIRVTLPESLPAA